MPERLTGGFDLWIKSQQVVDGELTAEVSIEGNAGEKSTLLYVAGAGEWQAFYNNEPVECSFGIPGCLEIVLPKNSQGTLSIRRK